MAEMSVIHRMTELSEALWQEQSLDRVLRRFVAILKEHFQVPCVSCYQVSRVAGRLTLNAFDLGELGGSPLLVPLVMQLEAHLNLITVKDSELAEGINPVLLGEESLAFFLVGDLSTNAWLLAWDEAPTVSMAGSGVRHMLDFLSRQVQQLARWFARLDSTQAMLYRDDLTGLYNYRYLDIALDAELRRAGRFQSPFALLFIDLDNFKPVNDIHGHLAGSQVLRQVAEVLLEGMREVDSVFRYGGDEYVVLLVEANSQAGALAAERMRRRIEAADFRVDGGSTVRLSASIGVASCPEHGSDKESLIRIADQSMYKSKNSGKNRVTVATRDSLDERKSTDEAQFSKAPTF